MRYYSRLYWTTEKYEAFILAQGVTGDDPALALDELLWKERWAARRAASRQGDDPVPPATCDLEKEDGDALGLRTTCSKVEIAEEFKPPVLEIIDGVPKALSKDVALYFDKEHKNVLRDIENLISDMGSELALNFERKLSEGKIGDYFERTHVQVPAGNGATRDTPAFYITKKGFALLGMGFTGKRALRFKVAYIDAFERMEEKLAALALPPPPPPLPQGELPGKATARRLKADAPFDVMVRNLANCVADRVVEAVQVRLSEQLPALQAR
jgi:Rha family phage regulatory protein